MFLINLLVNNVFEGWGILMEKNVNCNLGVEDSHNFDELMEKYTNRSLGKFYLADGLRECIRFTWEYEDKVK